METSIQITGLPKVQNMQSYISGREIANQFIITTDNAVIFQSYETIIAVKFDNIIYLDKNKWDYSTTTGKYRNQFLGMNKKETEQAINEGKIILKDLNK